ncbi:MAG: sensor domain-containing diguanylate cyclase [Candidatus Omnitrophica bacterium]|nr:sensor domain-containing diguanylate cyclase [Candidatus Omnitrophota bacterium]
MYKIFLYSVHGLIIICATSFSALGKVPFFFSLLIVLFSLGSLFFFRKMRLDFFNSFRRDCESDQESINLKEDAIRKEQEILNVLPLKKDKVSFLFNVSKRLLEMSDSDEVYDFLVKTARNLFPQSDEILLYLFDKRSLELVRSFRKDKQLIKEKKGGILDRWVLRHNMSLIVDNLAEDFRFDSKRVIACCDREMVSFIVSPLSVGDKLIGTMRVESKEKSSFSLDDSRLLRSVCDLGVLVLERAHYIEKARDLAIRDPLTGLYLKEYFFMRCKEEIKRAQIKKNRVGIMILDIDDFKNINDSYGHIVGDLVLKRLAKILNETVDDVGSLICRFGGEEFIFFIVECDIDKLKDIGETLRAAVESSTLHFRRKSINFTISCGGVIYPDTADDFLDLIDSADKLLYKAKRKGKNKVCFQ